MILFGVDVTALWARGWATIQEKTSGFRDFFTVTLPSWANNLFGGIWTPGDGQLVLGTLFGHIVPTWRGIRVGIGDKWDSIWEGLSNTINNLMYG